MSIFEKISSYNLFNYLFPGVLFAVLATAVTPYKLMQDDLVAGAFVYYFIGMVISRLGSTILEPLLKWTKVVRFANYRDFVSATEADEKLELLSEVNNTYRTLSATFLSLLLLKGYGIIDAKFGFGRERTIVLLAIVLAGLFIVSYRKQTSYIAKRVARVRESRKE